MECLPWKSLINIMTLTKIQNKTLKTRYTYKEWHGTCINFMNRCSRNVADTDQRTVKTIQKVKPFFHGNIRTYENVKYSPSFYFKQTSIFKVSFIHMFHTTPWQSNAKTNIGWLWNRCDWNKENWIFRYNSVICLRTGLVKYSLPSWILDLLLILFIHTV